jgi:DNA topoisomerase-1
MKLFKEGKVITGEDGKVITNKAILAYAKKLVVPPKYSNVVIFYEKDPKILFQGTDAKGRLQQIYSKSWNEKAARAKFCVLLNFAQQIPNITAKSRKLMKSKKHTLEKMIALIINVVMLCYFRIGNRKYQELYGSFGAMNILKKHVKITDAMYISFIGKKGVLNNCITHDAEVIEEINKLLSKRTDSEHVFQWDNDGVMTSVKATDINDWLKEFDPLITSKCFRTYDANILIILYLRAQTDPEQLTKIQRKKIAVSAVADVCEAIHNTPAIFKSRYEGGIIEMYINEPSVFKGFFLGSKEPRLTLMGYLSPLCR